MSTRIRFRLKREKRAYRSFLRRWYNYLILFNPDITLNAFIEYESIKSKNDPQFFSNIKLIKEGF